jgi:hypothetical protein
MTQETQVLFALLVYLAFFGWIGWRRGLRSELTVFLVALIGWILLQERGNIFVRVTNLGVKFAAVFFSSLATGEEPTVEDINAGNNFVADGAESTFLFLLWIVLLFGAYVLTSRPGFAAKSKKGGWAGVVGALNGLLLLAVLLPKLSTLAPQDGQPVEAPLQTFSRLLSSLFSSLSALVQSLWNWVSEANPVVLLVIVTAVLGLAAMTLRSGAKAKG